MMPKESKMKKQQKNVSTVRDNDLFTALAANCVQIRVTVKRIGGTKGDPNSREVLADHYNGQQEGFTSAALKYLPPDITKGISHTCGKPISLWQRNTRPYREGDWNIMLAKLIPEMTTMMDASRVEIEQGLPESIIKRRAEVEAFAKKALGDAYPSTGVLPPDDIIRASFRLIVQIQPIALPVANLKGLTQDEVEKVREACKTEMLEGYKESLKSLLDDLAKQVDEAIKRLKEKDQKKVRYDGVFRHFINALATMKKLNVANDETIDKFVDSVTEKIEHLADCSDVRTDDQVRAKAMKDVQSITSLIGGFKL